MKIFLATLVLLVALGLVMFAYWRWVVSLSQESAALVFPMPIARSIPGVFSAST